MVKIVGTLVAGIRTATTSLVLLQHQITVSTLNLGSLSDNGGPTQTMALGSGSAAIDTGSCTDIDGNTVSLDQRGATRPGGSSCDIGAYETNAAEGDCDDSQDNDNDGITDSDDSDCGGTESSCTDLTDNDGDESTDCNDSDCTSDLACSSETTTSSDSTTGGTTSSGGTTENASDESEESDDDSSDNQDAATTSTEESSDDESTSDTTNEESTNEDELTDEDESKNTSSASSGCSCDLISKGTRPSNQLALLIMVLGGYLPVVWLRKRRG